MKNFSGAPDGTSQMLPMTQSLHHMVVPSQEHPDIDKEKCVHGHKKAFKISLMEERKSKCICTGCIPNPSPYGGKGASGLPMFIP